jgi:hypothetical protein
LSLSDRGGAPSEVRELAIDCLHPANISPDFELRGEYLNVRRIPVVRINSCL